MIYIERVIANNSIVVCPLTELHRPQVEYLDTLSYNDVKGWLEDNIDYAWGIFVGTTLIGYCTIGGADVLEFELGEYKEYSSDALLLSDVFIEPKYRRKGHAVQMVNAAIEQRNKEEQASVFLTLLDDDLQHLYKHCGFKNFCEGFMIK